MAEDIFITIYLILLGTGVCLYVLIPWLRRRKQLVPRILAAEKKRRKYPDIQGDKFTRLYTMPYSEDVTERKICAYFEEHFPEYRCSYKENYVLISEKASKEERELHIVHLPHEDITAIELVDPREIVSNGRFASHARTSLYDLGFGDSIRESIRYFQKQAIAHKRL